MYLELGPAGSGQMKGGTTIPITRTASPYDVVEAFEGLAERTGDIDVEQLTTSLNTLTELTADTPDEFRSALTSVSALSQNLAARDDQINTLPQNPRTVSGVLCARDHHIIDLMMQTKV